MKYLLLLTFCWPLFLHSQPFTGKIGVNLDALGGVALEFPNVTPTASPWQSVATGANAMLDSIGWPTEDFRALFFDHRPFNAWNNAPDDPEKYVVDLSGTYTLSFNGQATLTSWSDAPIQFLNQAYDVASNTTTVDISFPSGGGANQALIGNYGFLMINFLQTNYSTGVSGVKNIRLLRPGYQNNSPQIFRAGYLNAISPFSTMRFMNYLNTNNRDSGYPSIQTWNERQKANVPYYTKGAPWEVVIALGNFTGQHIWINIPVDADSMYVVQLATMMKNTLRPDVNIYIEYSNEVWNNGFTQYQYNYDAVLYSSEDSDIRASTSFDDRRRARMVAKQVIQFGNIFSNVYGIPLASRSKIRPVFAWQFGGWLPWYQDVLGWINSTYGPPKNFIYGIASAPYFGDGNAASNATPQQVVAAMSANCDGNVANIDTLAEYANQWQIKHLQYEGGPDNGGGSSTNIGNRILANRLPDMKTAVIHNYADNWYSASANGNAPLGTNDLANYFVMSGAVSRYGCWGATEDLKYIHSLSNAPKYDALCTLTGMCGNEPSDSLTAPINNTQVPVNTPTTLSASASSPDGKISRVEFFVGSNLVGVDSVAPYSVSWTPTQTGIASIQAKAIDATGKYTFTEGTVVEITEALALNETNNNVELTVYPIPANQYFTVSIHGLQDRSAQLKLSDIEGKTLLMQSAFNGSTRVEIGGLSDDAYFLSLITTQKVVLVRKVMVVR